MAYIPTVWNDGGPPPISAANLQKLETGLQAAAAVADAAEPATAAAAAHQTLQTAIDGKAAAGHTHTGLYDPEGSAAAAAAAAAAYTDQELSLMGQYVDQQTDTRVENIDGAAGMWVGTQTEYDAIATPSPTVVYVILP